MGRNMGQTQALSLATLLGLIFPLSASAESYHYVSFLSLRGAPTDQYVAATGINDDGVIIGNDGAQGFVFANNTTSYVAIPGATATTLDAIDRAGDIIGYTYTQLLYEQLGFSFSDMKGALKPILSKGMPVGVRGFNSRGEFLDVLVRNNVAIGRVLKSYADTSSGYALYAPKPFSMPNVISMVPKAINDHGQIVGVYYDRAGQHSFSLADGVYTSVDVPGGSVTRPLGINDSGTIAGSYYDPNQNRRETGFVLKDGVFTTIYFPGAQGGTHVNGISEGGAVVGYYYDNLNVGTTGFIARPKP